MLSIVNVMDVAKCVVLEEHEIVDPNMLWLEAIYKVLGYQESTTKNRSESFQSNICLQVEKVSLGT